MQSYSSVNSILTCCMCQALFFPICLLIKVRVYLAVCTLVVVGIQLPSGKVLSSCLLLHAGCLVQSGMMSHGTEK